MKTTTPTEDEEANLFAMALLMPEALVRAEVRKMGGLDLCDDRAVKKLADKFKVPASIMAIHIGQIWQKCEKASV